jgi:hypothetical protein
VQGSSCKALATVTWHFVGPPRSCLGCCCSAPYHGRISSSHHYNNSCTAAPLYSVDAAAWQTAAALKTEEGPFGQQDMQHWHTQGFVILRKAAPDHAVDAVVADIWKLAQRSPDDRSSWYRPLPENAKKRTHPPHTHTHTIPPRTLPPHVPRPTARAGTRISTAHRGRRSGPEAASAPQPGAIRRRRGGSRPRWRSAMTSHRWRRWRRSLVPGCWLPADRLPADHAPRTGAPGCGRNKKGLEREIRSR